MKFPLDSYKKLEKRLQNIESEEDSPFKNLWFISMISPMTFRETTTFWFHYSDGLRKFKVQIFTRDNVLYKLRLPNAKK